MELAITHWKKKQTYEPNPDADYSEASIRDGIERLDANMQPLWRKEIAQQRNATNVAAPE
jgi:hypothetical protein